MKTIRQQLLALGFAGLLTGLAIPTAQATGNLHFQRLSLAEGLSQTTVNAVLQDHHGFMWFGTLEGLNRFDGYDFKVYQHDPADSTSLSQDTVRSLVEDKDGVLWIGTDKGGLNRFDEARGSFTHYRHNPEDPHSLSHDRIRVMAFDQDGVLWIGTDGGGLNRFDPLTERFTRFPFESAAKNSLGHAQVRALHVASDGRIWIGTDGGGLAVLDPTTGEFDHHRHDPADSHSLRSDNVYSIYEDRAGALWVGTANGGAHRFEPETGAFTRLETPGPSAVRTILRTSEDCLLVGTDNGLWVWARRDGTPEAYRHDSSDLYSLSHDRITSLFQDRGGVIWIGTFNGLNKWNPTAGAFSTFRSEADNPNSLSQSYVTSFAEGEDGAVWIGTMGGISRLDRGTGSFERFQHDPADGRSLADNRVMSLLRDSEGRIWAGMIGGGLGRLDPATGRFTAFKNQPDDETSLSFNGVTTIFEDRFGTMWVGTYRGGLNRWRPETESFVRYRHDPADPASLSSDRVVALYEDQRGTLWIGTDGGGLNRYERRLDAFVSYRYDAQRPTSLSSDHAWTITEDTDGDLWVGTQGGGLNRWTSEDRRADRPVFQRFLKKDGLLSSTVYATLWDGEGNLWLSSNRGISAFNPESGLFRHYNTSHGLQSDEFNFAAALRTTDGKLFFGGVDGFNVFDPETIRVNENLPPVVLTSVLKFNQPVVFDQPTAEVESLEISHNDSVITFEFAGLDYTAPEKNRYRYILEGFDRDWVEIGRRNRVTYTNLDPGRYTLRVQAANNDGRWNRQGLTIAITAAPPPWATWWAYSSYTFIAFLIGAVFLSDQKNRQRRARALEKANEDLQLEIFERQRAEGELSKLSLAVEQSPASVIITDREGRIDYVNPNFVKVTGYSRDEVRGQSLDLLRSGYASDAQNNELWRCIEAGEAWRGEVHSRKKCGEMFWEEASVSPILGPDGKISHLLAINEDLTVRKQYELRLLRQAHYDHLTHLPNRTLALDRLSRSIARTRAEGKLVAVMFMDLDNFKIVNDTMGHAAGDQLLKITASRLHGAVRDSDTVARLGGDEFLFVLGDLEGLVEVESAARRILDCFAEPIAVDGREIFVTASLGITIAPNDSDEPQVLLRNADAAMYRAKEAGRDAYQFFTPAMNEHAVARLQLESNLRQALQRRELFIEYQPLVLADGGKIIGAEALLRWRNPRLGRVSPGDFIPVAEDTGLIVPIGEWVLETACREAHSWSLVHGEKLRIAVNISARQLRSDAHLVDTVKRALERCGLAPGDLELEVTEGVLLDDKGEAAAILEELHEMGVRLSIDDFGTGYSSLRYLRQFPFDVLKIDRSFVQDLLGRQGNSPLVRAIIAMAGGLGLEVVGEGVETQTQLALLRAMGCHLVQGFLFSRPVPGRTLAKMLAEGGQLDQDAEEPEAEEESPFRPRLVAG